MTMECWMDAHNHLHDPRLGDAGPAVDAMVAEGVGACVVNATREDDWAAVGRLATQHAVMVWPAYGVHPWQAHTVTKGWLERLRERLLADPRASVGEIGLDQWVSEPSLQVQRDVFEAQLRLARELQRPATIHCLKAWGALFEVLEDYPPPDTFLMHSFNGSLEVVQRLIPMGAYFSFSGYFLHQKKEKVVEVFCRLPRERVLLETDAPDMSPPEPWRKFGGEMNHPANVPMIGAALAEKLGVTPAELADLTRENTARCFGMA